MKQRGRKSAAALATSAVIIDIHQRLPPRPPSELKADERQTWRDIVQTLPAGWVEVGARPLLVQLVRHVARARFLDREINRLQPGNDEAGIEKFCRLAEQARDETRAILSLSKALRLAPSSRMHPRTAARKLERLPPPGRKPWDARA